MLKTHTHSYKARHCCCWPVEGGLNFTARVVTI